MRGVGTLREMIFQRNSLQFFVLLLRQMTSQEVMEALSSMMLSKVSALQSGNVAAAARCRRKKAFRLAPAESYDLQFFCCPGTF